MQHSSSGSAKQKRLQWVALTSLIVVMLACHQLWQAWPTLVLKSIEWQRIVNNQLADLLYDARENPLVSGGYLAGFSFLYGILHALGPGHGKVIVTTYLATQPAKAKASLVLTFVSALCQAMVAVALVSVLLWGLSASTQDINRHALNLMTLSSGLIIVLGVMICWRVFRSLLFKKAPRKAACDSHHQEHDHSCGCGHQHVVSPEAINQASSLREYIGVILSIGLRPCTGAIMVLFFANMVGLYWMGVVSALLMSMGTAITTSALALMTLSGKKIVRRYLSSKQSHQQRRWQWAGYGLQLLGGSILILLGLLLINSQSTGLSPMLMT
ncbi:membrane protein [Endozoicomonas montiporae]|uniref:Nickel/cobalt efflux system n=2 Tax=Endozoicomonas montiporae TaxID=1027273 RepID=A0A081MZT2_9GAMM|nr:membrane protein [Endozoicomonas montiporae]